MFGGGGGLNPRKMQQMMEQMGIDLDELDAAEVVITLADGDRLVFDDAEVTRMEARGQETYQVLGDPERRGPAGTEDEAEAEAGTGDADADDGGEGDAGIPDGDVELVVERTGATPGEAREALDAEDGDLAAAISRLE